MIVRELLTKIGFTLDERNLKKAEQSVQSFKKSAQASLTSLRNVGLGMSLAITTPLVMLGKSAIQTAAEFENLEIAFETFLGSTEKAKAMIKDLTDFASKSPLSIKGVMEQAKFLQAVGIEAQELLPSMKMLTDISSGVGIDKFGRLAYAFGQVKSAGFLKAQDMRQFTETGVDIADALSKVTGFSKQDIAGGDVASLKIPFEKVVEALKTMTSEGGKFYNLTEKQNKSTMGQYNEFRERLVLVGLEFGKEILPILRDDILPVLQEMVSWVQKLSPAQKKWVFYIGLVVAALGPLMAIFSQIGLIILSIGPTIKAFGFIFSSAFGIIALKIAAVLSLLGGIYLIYDDIMAYIQGRPSLFEPVYKKIEQGINWIKEKWTSLVQIFEDVALVFREDWLPAIKDVWKVFAGAFGFISNAASLFITLQKSISYWLWDWSSAISEFVKKWTGLGNVFDVLKNLGGKFFNHTFGVNALADIQNRASQLRNVNPNSVVSSSGSVGGAVNNANLAMNQDITMNIETNDPEKIANDVKTILNKTVKKSLWSAMRNLSSPEVSQ